MNNATIVDLVIGVVTFVTSVSVSMFVAGTRWGRIEGRIDIMADRLAKIEGMFTLKLKDDDK